MATGLAGHFVAMAGNNAWANHRLLTRVQGADARGIRRAAHRLFPSLRATLNHILWVDIYYIDASRRDPTVLKRYDYPPPDWPMRSASTRRSAPATAA